MDSQKRSVKRESTKQHVLRDVHAHVDRMSLLITRALLALKIILACVVLLLGLTVFYMVFHYINLSGYVLLVSSVIVSVVVTWRLASCSCKTQ